MTVSTERHAQLAAEPGVVDLLTTPLRITVCVDGFGGRDGESFRKGYDTLRPIAWALHHRLRADERHFDHQLAPIEALWWTEDGVTCWRLLVSEPGDVPVDVVVGVVRDLPAVKNLPDARTLDVRVFDEGMVVQTLHLGCLDDVDTAMALLEEFAADHQLAVAGPRHEIYLSHVRRCVPQHMRTLIRVPVRPLAR
jgi:hypothetical protein